MKSAEEIVDLYYTRSSNYAGVKERMRYIRDHYNGDVIVPLPEIDSTEASSVANLLACLLYTSPSPRDLSTSRMPSSA